jgi:predicted ArsR family transcriptional regulator
MEGERQRESLLQALGKAPDGLDTKHLAARLGLHPNTVRWHLGALTDAGLVFSAPEPRRQRGRPSVVHRLTADGAARDRDEYRLLATMLTAAIASDANAEALAYDTGVRWGQHLEASEPGASVADLLDREGFAASEHDGRIEMRRCPFYALAEESPEVICTLHHGLIDGALAAGSRGLTVDHLDPLVEPNLCVAHLRAAERAGSIGAAPTTQASSDRPRQAPG